MISESLVLKPERKEFEWDVDAFFRATEQGFFLDRRYELIDGRLIEMPTEQPHSIVSTLFFEALAVVFGDAWLVWTERPLRLFPKTRPTPDVTVIPGPLSRWFQRMPKVGDARLIVEVSASTLSDDLGRKAEIYATEGVEEYWVVDVYGDRLLIHTEPRDGFYRNRRELRREDSVPYVEKPLSDLIPVKYRREDAE
ncbi:Uma2 family endonuclease [soil metagenome]